MDDNCLSCHFLQVIFLDQEILTVNIQVIEAIELKAEVRYYWMTRRKCDKGFIDFWGHKA